jgi:flagellar hook protein FlgE
MGMLTSLFTGVSGLAANGQGLSVVGDNIANSNTHGFKGSRAIFADILSSSLGGGGAFQVGRGSYIQNMQSLFTQGTLETSANPLDMAIEGDGFFVLKDTGGAQYFTRAGQYNLDKDGNIVNPEGLLLQGKLLTGTQAGQVATINVAALNSPPNRTSEVEIAANLNSAAQKKDPTSQQTFEITDSNNTIRVDNNDYSIPVGTYTGAGLVAVLNPLLQDLGAVVTEDINVAYDFNINGSATDYKFTFTNAATSTASHTINWSHANCQCEQILGFAPTDQTLAVGASTTSAYQAVGFDALNPTAFDPTGKEYLSTSITVYDSLGYGHLVTVYFSKTAEGVPLLSDASKTGNRWHWYAVAQGTDHISGQNQVGAQGYLEFDDEGRLVSDTAQIYGGTGNTGFDFAGGVSQDQAITLDFGIGTAQAGSGRDKTTQYGSANSVIFQTQDGYSSGSLISMNIDQTGTMVGSFTNGQTIPIAEIYLARFIAPTMLTKQGRNLYAESAASGSPIIGSPNTSGRGRVMASSLETSNVDLAEEFVRMISYQRGFQANTRVITTTDDMLTELMQLKR